MATKRRCWWPNTIAIPLLFILFTTANAEPRIAFPFNSQVPAVARVNEPYLFQFSNSTFAPNPANYAYSLSNQPSWLTIDSSSQTLSGTPGSNDYGAFQFDLTAADSTGAAHMQCTLVVSLDPAPQLEGDISKQLAATTNLSNSEPPIVTILPSSAFKFDFGPSSFIDAVKRTLYYYATMADHTPLPSWLSFNNETLTFSGTAPDLSAFPQSWTINLIASDVVGFSGATASFTIAISQQQLVFVPEEQHFSISDGQRIDLVSLKDQIFRDGVNVGLQDLTNVKGISIPSWLEFDPSTLEIVGSVPSNTSDQTFQIIVTDVFGNTASATINLLSTNNSVFRGTIGSLTAYVGEAFIYKIPDSLLGEPGLDLTVTLPETAKWLSFIKNNHELQGTVPSGTRPETISGTLTAKASNLPQPQSQTFTINIKSSSSTTSSTSGSIGSGSSPSSSSTSSHIPAGAIGNSHHHLSKAIIAVIVVLAVLIAVILIVCLMWCSRREKQRMSKSRSTTPEKSSISRPMLDLGDAEKISPIKLPPLDIESSAESQQPHGATREGSAPQIVLDWPNVNRRSKPWIRTSHISQTSSIGNGEDVIRVDSNIPEWGQESAALNTPHDSFSVPMEMARFSRRASQLQLSPTKRALKRLRDRRESRHSVGLGIRQGYSAQSLQRANSHRRGVGSLGLSAAMTRSSQTSLSTRGTSVLSTREFPFPRPPTKSAYSNSKSVSTILSAVEDERNNTIRLLGRTESVADTRPLAEKRQSFIRNRASTSYHTPLFSHMSKADSGSGVHNRGSVRGSSLLSASERRSRYGNSQTRSSLEPKTLDPKVVDTRRFSQRLRTSFGPNFPRALTKSSLGADDEVDDSDFYTTSSSISVNDFVAEMALPRHQRSWVLPGEASPTPTPPAPSKSQYETRKGYTNTKEETKEASSKWRSQYRERSNSPLSNLPTLSVISSADYSSPLLPDRPQFRKSVLSGHVSSASNGNFTTKMERPRLVVTNPRRPVSVADPQRMISLRAENGTDSYTQAGSEIWETPMEGTGLLSSAANDSSKGDTVRSNASGLAFI